jgi:inner membrane protein
VLLLAHVGITLGVALAGDAVYTRLSGLGRLKAGENPSLSPLSARTLNWRAIFDPRFWIMGALIPDLIDKPVGHFLFSEVFFGNGRIFSHTLLLFLILMGAGLYLVIARKKRYLLALSCGVLMHLLLDGMWQTPQTLWWPFLGWSFPQAYDASWLSWLEGLLYGLLNDPGSFIPEIVGLILIIYFTGRLVRRKRLLKFFREGRY